jgi:NADPH-dependent 2,4-dienoyl-CoA reductase/sulfur reductase-like enzyme
VTRHVIVGGGIAGLSAAEALRAADPRASITLVDAEASPFYSRPGMVQLVARVIPERQLAIRTAAELRDLALDRVVDRVTALDGAAHAIAFERRAPLRWDRLLLATGSTAIPPDFPGAALAGVLQLDTLADARRILSLSRRARSAVVVGDGPLAAGLAEALTARRVRVRWLLPGDRFWPEVLDPFESGLLEDALERQDIELVRRTRAARALGRGGRVTAIETDSGATLPGELVVVAAGVRPRLELARSAGLAVDRGVLVDQRLETSAPDLFAAGDIAQGIDPDAGAGHTGALWSSALAAGRHAGRAMAGDSSPFRPPPALGSTRIGGLRVAVIGAVAEQGAGAAALPLRRGESGSWRASAGARAFHDRGDGRAVRALVGDRGMLGAVVIGDSAASRALCRLIRDRAATAAAMADLLPRLLDEPSRAIARLVELGDRLTAELRA